jgi:site-specific DNA-methyltransferase (adenine-specific)
VNHPTLFGRHVPYYEHAGITIYHCDCREILPHLPKADAVITDPPYAEVNRTTKGLRFVDKGCADAELFPLIKLLPSLTSLQATSFYIWCGIGQISDIRLAFVEAGMSVRLCIWEKSNPSPMNGEYLWLSSIEYCVFGRRKGATFNELCKSPVFRGPIADANGHPTPKPEWLLAKIIHASTDLSQTILDPFMGSGTTLVAAKNLGRKAIGIEIEEKYCEIAARRLEQEVFDFSPLPPRIKPQSAPLFAEMEVTA